MRLDYRKHSAISGRAPRKPSSLVFPPVFPKETPQRIIVQRSLELFLPRIAISPRKEFFFFIRFDWQCPRLLTTTLGYVSFFLCVHAVRCYFSIALSASYPAVSRAGSELRGDSVVPRVLNRPVAREGIMHVAAFEISFIRCNDAVSIA